MADGLVPGTNGSVGRTGQSPCAAWRSVWQTPLATTRTSTSRGPGSGIGRSSIVSGPPNERTTAARIIAIALLLPQGLHRATLRHRIRARAAEAYP